MAIVIVFLFLAFTALIFIALLFFALLTLGGFEDIEDDEEEADNE
ncbi:MAG: hypothetical protein ACRC5T_03275 [Cetobacterium sp.]